MNLHSSTGDIHDQPARLSLFYHQTGFILAKITNPHSVFAIGDFASESVMNNSSCE